MPKGVSVYGNTVRSEVMNQAAFTSAQVFGAVGAFDRYIRPALGKEVSESGVGAIGLDYNVVLNTANALGRCGAAECNIPADKEVLQTLDLYNSSFAFLYGGKHFGVFATGSYTLAFVPGTGLNRVESAYITIMGPVLVFGLWWLRLFGKKAFSSIMPGSLEAVGGVYGRVGPVQGYGGYILSQGIFGDISLPGLSPFGTAAITDKLEQASLLKAGLRQFTYLDSKVIDTIGTTSLYARRVLLDPPRSLGVANPSALVASSADFSHVPLTTGHLEQLDIMGLFDLRASYAVKPTPLLHELRVGAHTPRYNYKQNNLPADGDIQSSAFSATVGMVQFPDLFYYGVAGGKRFSMSLEGGGFGKFMKFKGYIRFNDPELLTPFPFAYNALSLGVSFSGAGPL